MTAIDPRHDQQRRDDGTVRKHQVPGAQLAIHHGGETVAIESVSWSTETGRRVTGDAAFPVGSISKTFTATVAMILVADGDLELDDPVGEHLAGDGSPATGRAPERNTE